MNTPKIRFKGFTDDWEQRKLGEHCVMYNGDRSSKYPNAQDMVEEGIPFINAGDLENGHVNLAICNKISREKYNDLGGAKLQLGDIVYCLRGTLGKNAYIDNFSEGTVASSLVVIRPKNINGRFMFHILNSDIEYRQRIVHDEGAAQPNLSAKNVAGFLIPVPHIDEQKKISKYFDNIDHLITLHQRKCDETKQLKKFMLQKMFPKNGEKNPEIRFEGFTDDWEQRKLIEVCDYVDYRGKTPTKVDNGIFLVTAKNVKAGYIDYESSKEYISEDDYEEVMHRGKPEIGDVLITTEAPCGNVAQVNTSNIALAQRIIKYRGHKNVIDNTYLKHYMLAPYFQEILFEKSSGGTVQGIKGSILHQQHIIYPMYDEQLKIGEYFDSLDDLITLHQRKCEKLKELKKYMLQNMFV